MPERPYSDLNEAMTSLREVTSILSSMFNLFNLNEGPNSLKLKEINYTDSIPEYYRCPLMMNIMSEPVYVRQHPNHRFEKSWILFHLLNNENNPLNREPMTADDLIDDISLKEEISEFVEAQLNVHRSTYTAF